MTATREDLQGWLERVSGPDWVWYAKFIAANDTSAKPNVHQGGPYLGKELLRLAFPALTARADREENPDLTIGVSTVSHRLLQDIRVVWYNSKRLTRQANGRDEARMTQWGGKDHPLLAAEATGSLVIFAFHRPLADADADGCEVWIADEASEQDDVFGMIGPVEPGAGVVYQPRGGLIAAEPTKGCSFSETELLDEWRDAFPSGEDVLEMALQRLPTSSRLDPDARLMKRRECEYSLFLAIENHVILPRVREGFIAVEEFVAYANAVTNRRKSRAGKSLELQARVIFNEESVSHSWGERTEGRRTPDFMFPSIDSYRDSGFAANRLRMLAAKTTCKDRWRQILNEAKRVTPIKHLLTLQEGVSVAQYQEMKDEGVRLVVPKSLHSAYPESVQPELVTLAQFIGEAKAL